LMREREREHQHNAAPEARRHAITNDTAIFFVA
jgi:hypothetical protein